MRYLCKRVRQALPGLRILIGRWDYHGDRSRTTVALKHRGASEVVTSLQEARDYLQRVQPLAGAAPGPGIPAPHLPRPVTTSQARV
jgi:hypothetical protein